MNKVIITEGQSLLDVCLQELGSLDSLLELADYNSLAITDDLEPGQLVLKPDSLASARKCRPTSPPASNASTRPTTPPRPPRPRRPASLIGWKPISQTTTGTKYMGALSTAILNALGLNIISGRKNTAANVRAVVGTIADAISTLEGLQRGARILSGAGVPAAALGNDGDAYINTSVSDLYLKADGAWGLRLVLRGNNGASAFQSWLNTGNQGTELAFVLSLRGQDGKSAYQSWLQAGNQGRKQSSWPACQVGAPTKAG